MCNGRKPNKSLASIFALFCINSSATFSWSKINENKKWQLCLLSQKSIGIHWLSHIPNCAAQCNGVWLIASCALTFQSYRIRSSAIFLRPKIEIFKISMRKSVKDNFPQFPYIPSLAQICRGVTRKVVLSRTVEFVSFILLIASSTFWTSPYGK